jgi:hypothetical protein
MNLSRPVVKRMLNDVAPLLAFGLDDIVATQLSAISYQPSASIPIEVSRDIRLTAES